MLSRGYDFDYDPEGDLVDPNRPAFIDVMFRRYLLQAMWAEWSLGDHRNASKLHGLP